MINVVFLLLIFFLMTSEIAPPEPFEVDLPEAERDDPADGPAVLFLSTEGEVAFQDLGAEEAIAMAVEEAGGDTLQLRADSAASGTAIARLLADLGKAGVSDVNLLVAVP